MRAAVIIPARYGSTRFPGKILMRGPSGKPLIQYVWENAVRARGIDRVIVATDDERIMSAVTAFGGEARMTAARHASGSDRCAEVAADLDHDVIVNLQGDEPGMTHELISRTVSMLAESPDCDIATLACPIETESDLADFNTVKVVLDASSSALYFSRAPIPHVRGSSSPVAESPAPHLAHLGIYAFRREALMRFAALDPHPLEKAEKLEQLRALANGFIIKVDAVPERTLKVDTLEDFQAFCKAAQADLQNNTQG